MLYLVRPVGRDSSARRSCSKVVVWALGFVLGWLGKEVIEALGATAGAWVGLAGFVRWLRVAWLGR